MYETLNNGDFNYLHLNWWVNAGIQPSTQRATPAGFFVFFLLVQDGANSFAPFQKEVYEGVILFRYMFGANIDGILQ